jgi:hypothetical protein
MKLVVKYFIIISTIFLIAPSAYTRELNPNTHPETSAQPQDLEMADQEDFLYDTDPFDETALPATENTPAKEEVDENATAVEMEDTSLKTDNDYDYDPTFFTEAAASETETASDTEMGPETDTDTDFSSDPLFVPSAVPAEHAESSDASAQSAAAPSEPGYFSRTVQKVSDWFSGKKD